MAFAVGLELFVNSEWFDITPDLSADGVEITRGRANEGQKVDPTRMSCKLRNSDGRYSPRNPGSSLFGLIGRNTPIRFWEETGEPRIVQDAYTYWYCADSAGLSVTGDIDLRMDIAPRSWRPSAVITLGLIKGSSYTLGLLTDGRISLAWNDSADAAHELQSSVPAPGGITGRKAIRATLDVDNGAGKHTATFYHADTLAGPWTQFGAVAQGNSATDIKDSADAMGTLCELPCEVFGTEVRDGIDGTAVTSVDWTTVTLPATEFEDAQGNVWTPGSAGATLTNRHYRFVGEVTSWPQRWGTRGARSAYAPIECSGVLRRLGQGASPLQSALRRGCQALPNLAAYWPMEDGRGAKDLASAVGGQPMTLSAGSFAPKLADYSGFVGSAPIPTLPDGATIGVSIPHYPSTGRAQVRFIAHVPPGTTGAVPATGLLVAQFRTSGTLRYVNVNWVDGSGWQVRTFDQNQTQTALTGFVGNLPDKNVRVSVELRDSGSDTLVKLVVIEEGQGGTLDEVTSTGTSVGSVTSVRFNDNADLSNGTAVGHLTVESVVTSVFDVSDQFEAYVGERADTRMLRLASENAISLSVIGSGAGCERLGPQGLSELVGLLSEAAESDGGILFEPRSDNSLRYRSLESLWSQAPAVTIAYTDNLLLPFEPVDDDDSTRNKVTVSRRDGGSYTVEDNTGPLGTAAPPAGVGIYDESVDLSLASDAAAEQQAGWRLHLGTTDEARWPAIGLDLAHPTFQADAALTRRILTLDVGDRLDVVDLPSWLPPYPVRQIVQGYTETIVPGDPEKIRLSSTVPKFHHKIVFNCTPARPYDVGTFVASSYETETSLSYTTHASDTFTGSNGAALSGTWTTGFTGSGHSAAIQGNRGRLTVGSSSLISRRVSGVSQADGTVTFTYRLSGDTTFNFLIRHNTTTLDRDTCYAVKLPTLPDQNIGIAEVTGYAGSFSSSAFAVSAATDYRVKIVVNGSSITVRVWAASGSEPGSPQASLTDSTITAAGNWGLYVGSSGSAGAYVEVDDFVWTDNGTTNTTITPIDAGPSTTRYCSGGSQLSTVALVDDTTLSVSAVAGPAWTTVAEDLPLDLLVGGEQVTATAISSPLSNLSPNPSVETNSTGWGQFSVNSTDVRQTSGGYDGAAFMRIAWTGVATTGAGHFLPSPSVTAGLTYTSAVYVRSNVAQVIGMTIEWKDVGSTLISTTAGPDVTLVANTWTKISATGLAPVGAVTATPTAYSRAAGVSWANADTLDADAAMFYLGSDVLVSYALLPRTQSFTVTRAVNGVVKEHAAGTTVDLLDPVYWGARPLGGTLFGGGGDTGGGGPDPDPQIPNTVRIGTATYPLSGVNPGLTGGWGGDPNHTAYRGVDQLVVFENPPVSTTATNRWGTEVNVGADDIIDSVTDRRTLGQDAGVAIPSGDYVLSGHGAAWDWLNTNATVGAHVELIYVAAPGGGTGGGEGGGGGTGGGSVVFIPGGSYGDGVTYEQMRDWTDRRDMGAVATWSDNTIANQEGANSIAPGERHGPDTVSGQGIVNLAVGGIFGGDTWAAAAAGSYDSRWSNCLNNAKTKWGTRDPGKLHIRFAHEYNGSFSGWAVNDANVSNYVTAFRRFVNLQRSIFPGSISCWSPNYGTSSMTNFDSSYPGSAYVDVVGPDWYNGYPHSYDLASFNADLGHMSGGNPQGLGAWLSYAASKGKPMCLPECGNYGADSSGSGFGDHPQWATAFINWCRANGGSGPGKLWYACYFNISSGYAGKFAIYGNNVVQPQVAAVFKANW